MTQEDKNILLKDLCARLLYDVKIHYHYSNSLGRVLDEDRELDFSDVETLKYNIENQQNDWCEISWKPYLRPMSSMTEEEEDEYDSMFSNARRIYCNCVHYDTVQEDDIPDFMDWLLEHHFDYRGLIPMGLALEATEGMYKND